MDLFNIGSYVLHGGAKSDYKIDCDALSETDINAVAYLLSQRVGPFFEAVGIPKGGVQLANTIRKYRDPDSKVLLVCDDVYTTGGSFREFVEGVDGPYKGAVIFARAYIREPWVTPLFVMSPVPGVYDHNRLGVNL